MDTSAIKSFAVAALVAGALLCRISAAGTFKFFDSGELALVATDPPGVQEAAVPIYHNGTLVNGDNHKVIEAYDRVPGTSSYPLTWVDQANNEYLRLTYQKADGSTGTLGTSVIASPSYRTPTGLNLIPTVTRSDVTTGGVLRYDNTVTAQFGGAADVAGRRSMAADPQLGHTQVSLNLSFMAQQTISLATGAPFSGNDRFRVLTVSSMFSNETQFDANVVRWEDHEGNVHVLRLDNDTPRGAHLLPAPDELGSWFELVKEPTSSWFLDSPTIHVDLVNGDGLRLGLQGFLATSTLTSDDSLNIWLEWLDAPDTVPAGTELDIEFDISATPPALVPEPASVVLLVAGGLLLTLCRILTNSQIARVVLHGGATCAD